MNTIDFYFDFVSPYAYLAWRRAPRVLSGARLAPKPVLFGVLLAHYGHLGPAEIPPKRAFTIRDTSRRALEAGLTLNWPLRHPFRSLFAARLALAAADHPSYEALVDQLFRAAWERGEDLEDPAVCRDAIERAGIEVEGLWTRATSREVADALRAENERAIERGVFGVPTMFVDDELFFGDDQLERMARKLAGDDKLDHALMREIEARPFGLDRRQKSAPPSLGTPAVEVDAELGAHVVEVYKRTAFLRLLGVELVRIGSGVTEIALRVRDELRQQDGFVHAGVIATLADHNAGACAATVSAPGSAVLTIEFKLNLLRASVGPVLRCRSTILRAGRTITVAESEVFEEKDDKSTLVAKATVTLAVRANT